jgi:hypothetical protein
VFAFAGLLLSLVPTVMLVDELGVGGVLAIAHFGVAAVVIPLVAASLAEQNPRRRSSTPSDHRKTLQPV